MMSESDWNTLYQYLLDRLRELGLTELVLDVENAAIQRLEQERPSSSSGRSLRTTSVQPSFFDEHRVEYPVNPRALRPNEVVVTALNVMTTRLVELPAVLQAIERVFGKPLASFVWRPDAESVSADRPSEHFNGEDLAKLMMNHGSVSAVMQRCRQLVMDARA